LKAQGNRYDKVFRENMESSLPGLLKYLLNIHWVSRERLPENIQFTKEREADMLCKVEDENGHRFLLHIEYQVENSRDMVFRMAEYSIMMLRKYRLPVIQHVLYLGADKATMPTTINEEHHKFRYNLLDIKEVDYRIFLKLTRPEEKLWAILGNFDKEQPDIALRKIVEEVYAAADDELSRGRYAKQLSILAQLRNYKSNIDQIMGDIAQHFSFEKDWYSQYIHKRAMEEGLNQGKVFFVRNLLKETDFTDDRIAALAGVSLAMVRDIRHQISNG